MRRRHGSFTHEQIRNYRPSDNDMASILGNARDSLSRAAFSGGAEAVASVALYGADGSGNIPFLNTPVPAWGQAAVSGAASSLGADIALNAASNAGWASQSWEKYAIGLGVAGGINAWMQEGSGGNYTENFIIGGLSYWAGDMINSKVYQSPGMLMGP